MKQIISIIIVLLFVTMVAPVISSNCNNVHPSDKKTPGERLAALAIRHVYGFDY